MDTVFSEQLVTAIEQGMAAALERSTAICVNEMHRVFYYYNRRSEARRLGFVWDEADFSSPHSGFIWDEVTGYYYDAYSGFYYDEYAGLYYDGNSSRVLPIQNSEVWNGSSVGNGLDDEVGGAEFGIGVGKVLDKLESVGNVEMGVGYGDDADDFVGVGGVVSDVKEGDCVLVSGQLSFEPRQFASIGDLVKFHDAGENLIEESDPAQLVSSTVVENSLRDVHRVDDVDNGIPSLPPDEVVREVDIDVVDGINQGAIVVGETKNGQKTEEGEGKAPLESVGGATENGYGVLEGVSTREVVEDLQNSERDTIDVVKSKLLKPKTLAVGGNKDESSKEEEEEVGITFTGKKKRLLSSDLWAADKLVKDGNGSISDEGSYVIKIKGTEGWTYSSEQVLVVVGHTGCNANENINFRFTGLTLCRSVFGAVSGNSCSHKDGGPSNVNVELIFSSGDVVSSVSTTTTGGYSFKNIVPGRYKLFTSCHDVSIGIKGSQEVELGFSNGVIDDIFYAYRYDIRGHVVAQGNPILGVHFYLYSDDVLEVNWPHDFGHAPGMGKALCHAVSDALDSVLSIAQEEFVYTSQGQVAVLSLSNIRVLGTRLSKGGSIVITRTEDGRTLGTPGERRGIG